VNRIRIHLSRHLLATLLALAPLPTRLQSQSAHVPPPGPTIDAGRVGLSVPARSTPVSPRPEGTTLNRAGNVVMGAAVGAAYGWFIYTITVGALASDHGAPYKRGRRRWIIGGAVFGALVGAFSDPEHRRPAAAW
jgi:hypothetical protein